MVKRVCAFWLLINLISFTAEYSALYAMMAVNLIDVNSHFYKGIVTRHDHEQTFLNWRYELQSSTTQMFCTVTDNILFGQIHSTFAEFKVSCS